MSDKDKQGKYGNVHHIEESREPRKAMDEKPGVDEWVENLRKNG